MKPQATEKLVTCYSDWQYLVIHVPNKCGFTVTTGKIRLTQH